MLGSLRIAIAALGLAACAPARVVAPRAAGDPGTGVVAPTAAPREVELDRGEFAFTVRDRPAGGETFAITRTATGYRIASEVRLESGARLRLLDSELTTDARWRPIAARVRDVRDGGTITRVAGAPLVARAVSPLGTVEHGASRDVELYLAEYTMAHYAPLCAVAVPATRFAFPGVAVRVAAAPTAPGSSLVRRVADLGGALRVVVTCDGPALVAVEVPSQALVAVRPDRAAAVAAARPPRRRAPVMPASIVEAPRTVTVRAAIDPIDVTLACTWTRPIRTGPVPAVVLISGSGPQDRDSDSDGPGGVKLGLFRAIAWTLAEAGVASLRCDDRGVGGSSGEFGAATVETFLSDARAALAAVRAEPGVALDQLALVGHSEGAVIAAVIAARDRDVARVALLAGPGRPADVVLLEQVARTVARSGLPPAEAARALDHYRAAFAAIRAGAPLPDTPEAAEWSGAEAWIRSHLRHDAVAAVTAIGARPVLVVQGLADRQVSPVDADALAAAGRAGGATVIERHYPGVDHLLALSSTGEIAEYVEPDRSVAPQLLLDLAAFARGDRAGPSTMATRDPRP